jgi:transcriptional regulator with XRE-family HTH domain
MHPMARELMTLGQRLQHARKMRRMTQAQLAEAAELGQPAVSKLEKGDTQETPAIARLAAAVGVSTAWLERGLGPDPDWSSPSGGMAHAVSQLVLETVPTMTWEQIQMTDRDKLPPVFRVQIGDAAMAPRVPAGAWVQFDRRITPKPGDGVLLRDSTGVINFRYFRAGRPGTWEAHADNSAYAPMDSARDGLSVIAVLTAVEARWG